MKKADILKEISEFFSKNFNDGKGYPIKVFICNDFNLLNCFVKPGKCCFLAGSSLHILLTCGHIEIPVDKITYYHLDSQQLNIELKRETSGLHSLWRIKPS